MKTRIQINNFDELKAFVLSNELTKDQLQDLIFKTLNIFINKNEDKTEIINKIEIFLINHPEPNKRPLFYSNALIDYLD